jgi:hypothetical protein
MPYLNVIVKESLRILPVINPIVLPLCPFLIRAYFSGFAMKEMCLILATLVRRYELSLILGQYKMTWRIVPTFNQGFYNVGIKKRV